MNIAKFVHKSVNRSLPQYLQICFHKVSLTHKRSTRSFSSDNLSNPSVSNKPCAKVHQVSGVEGLEFDTNCYSTFKSLRKHIASKYWLHINIKLLDSSVVLSLI